MPPLPSPTQAVAMPVMSSQKKFCHAGQEEETGQNHLKSPLQLELGELIRSLINLLIPIIKV